MHDLLKEKSMKELTKAQIRYREDPEYREYCKRKAREAHEKTKDNPEYRRIKKLYSSERYKNNKEEYRKYYINWRKKNGPAQKRWRLKGRIRITIKSIETRERNLLEAKERLRQLQKELEQIL